MEEPADKDTANASADKPSAIKIISIIVIEKEGELGALLNIKEVQQYLC